MNHSELEQAVLDFVSRPNYKPVKPRVIAKQLGLDKNAAANLKRAVKTLVKSGRVAYGQNHLLLPAAMLQIVLRRPKPLSRPSRPRRPNRPRRSNQRLRRRRILSRSIRRKNMPSSPARKFPAAQFAGDRVTGIFRRMAGGYGFVRPSEAAPAGDRSGDIFIAANHARMPPAATRCWSPSRESAISAAPIPEGEIVEILERETHQFVGTYFEAAGNGIRADRRQAVFQAGVCRRPRRKKRPPRR